MLLFLYGQDTYRSRQKLKEIVAHYQTIHRSGLNLKFCDARKLSFRDFQDEFRQTPMFKEKKLIVLEHVFSCSQFKEEFLRNKEIFLRTNNIIVFFEENKVPENDPLLKLLKKNGQFQKFALLKGEELKVWAENEFAKQGVQIEELALNKLIEFVGNDLWRLGNEIKKTSLFVSKRADSRIKTEDIELLVKPKVETEIFETIDALAERNKTKALKLIEKHLEKGESPFYLLKMMTYQFRNLLLMKSGNPYQSGLHPFIIRKTLSLARNFSLQELKNIYEKLFETDLRIKTGKIPAEEGIRLLVAEI